jgi:hypothetical protein
MITLTSETPTASRSSSPRDEREQRDDEHPAAESEQRTEDAGGSAAGDHQERDRHVRSAA